MQSRELEAYLHAQIPLSRAMGVRVGAADVDHVLLHAPLAPNINHHETVFGGSVSALAILSAWSLVHLRLTAEGVASSVVIQRNSIDYERPVIGAFSAHSSLESVTAWERFRHILQRKGRARIAVQSKVEFDGEVAARFSGEFVAQRARDRRVGKADP